MKVATIGPAALPAKRAVLMKPMVLPRLRLAIWVRTRGKIPAARAGLDHPDHREAHGPDAQDEQDLEERGPQRGAQDEPLWQEPFLPDN